MFLPALPPARSCSNTQAIIYVVDSCDADRLPTSREEFQAILEEEELKEAAILVYANKQVGSEERGRVGGWVGAAREDEGRRMWS